MATPKTTLWERDPHTAAKHQILRSYLQAWFPILAKHNGRILYFEGFAGPGEYEGKEPGSPLVALDVALNQQAFLTKEVLFYFVESDGRRAEHLRQLIEERKESGLPALFELEVREGEFDPVLTEILNEVEAEGHSIAPTFAFIDPFGFSGLPMALIHRLLKHPRTEAFINFPIDSVNRFIEHPNEKINAHMVGLFGTEEALSVSAPGGNRQWALRQLYQRQLERAAVYVRFFTMYGPDKQPVYDLFFATNSLKGLEKMKEAMWRVDPTGTFRFSDATDPNQRVLFDSGEFHPAPLLDSILIEFGSKRGVPVEDVERWVLARTPFMGTHMRKALQLGEGKGTFTSREEKRGGGRRKRGTFPADAILDFVPIPRPPSPGDQPSLFG